MTQQPGILTSSLQVIQSLYCSYLCYSFSYLEANGWGKTLKMTYGIPHTGFCQVALVLELSIPFSDSSSSKGVPMNFGHRSVKEFRWPNIFRKFSPFSGSLIKPKVHKILFTFIYLVFSQTFLTTEPFSPAKLIFHARPVYLSASSFTLSIK